MAAGVEASHSRRNGGLSQPRPGAHRVTIDHRWRPEGRLWAAFNDQVGPTSVGENAVLALRPPWSYARAFLDTIRDTGQRTWDLSVEEANA